MKNQNVLGSSISFFLGSVGLFNGLRAFITTLRYGELENNFIGYNWEVLLVVFLVFVFTAGWWSEAFIEYLILNFGRKILFSFLIIVFLHSLIMLPSFLFPLGFIGSASITGDDILLSGFFYRLSLLPLHPEVTAKLRSWFTKN